MSRELTLLTDGSIEIIGRVVDSSNAVFTVLVRTDAHEWFGIYKPVAGERPLWDFEPGLHRRERAAYLLSERLGWGLVPPTVLRTDGPIGEGSLQWFVDAVEEEHYFTLYRRAPATHETLRRLALFDLVANNADRKSRHVLLGADGRVWGIDHGLCFAAEAKLRTVIWDFTGHPVPEDWLEDLAPLAEDVPEEVADLITPGEARALRRRVSRVLDHPVLPEDLTGRAYPWPLV